MLGMADPDEQGGTVRSLAGLSARAIVRMDPTYPASISWFNGRFGSICPDTWNAYVHSLPLPKILQELVQGFPFNRYGHCQVFT